MLKFGFVLFERFTITDCAKSEANIQRRKTSRGYRAYRRSSCSNQHGQQRCMVSIHESWSRLLQLKYKNDDIKSICHLNLLYSWMKSGLVWKIGTFLLGVVHKWRHANSGEIWPLHVTLCHSMSHSHCMGQSNYVTQSKTHPSPPRAWRHLWTTPYPR